MSGASSPASSLDFFESDAASDESDYTPRKPVRKAAPLRKNAKVTSTTRTNIRINLSVPKNSAVTTLDRSEGAGIEDERYYDDLTGKRVVDLSGQHLKSDYSLRPLWVDDRGNIIVEAFAPFAKQAQDFLVAISEPVSRPSLIHEYRITKPSLHSAMSIGLETKVIIEVLSRLSKTPLSHQLIFRIEEWTASFGKVRLVLKDNRYFLETSVPEFLQKLMNDPVIKECMVHREEEQGQMIFGAEEGARPRRDFAIPGTEEARRQEQNETLEVEQSRQNDAVIGAVIGIGEADEMDDEDDKVYSFEVSGGKDGGLNPNLEIQLKPMTVIRPYQEMSLAKMFGNGRARSGIIVLPCGAGKTLVGITAACTIKKSALVLCTSAVSVAQWKQQFLHFSNISERQICCFTQGEKEVFSASAGIVISTYSMIAKTGKRAHDAEKVMQFLRSREWGFLLLDEVHVTPADMFRKCINNFKVHAKLGLTATLVREDDRIGDLGYLIGPKLYEANWMDLAKNGHIATVQCAEVWCPMTPEFYREYLRNPSRKRILLHAMNPNKIQACQFLINYHEGRGDKVIVFSDNVFALEAYAKKLGKSFIHGGTPEGERLRILSRFQHDPQLNTIFLSKVGDTSIDLPEATCLIQISSHFGSRRQEAQRLGRILRAKRRNDEGFNAFFYSLVSKDTQEMFYSSKRQGFLIDQGYAFKVITELHGLTDMPNLVFPSKDEQLSLLELVLNQGDSAAETADHYMRLNGGKHQKKTAGSQPTSIGGPTVQRFMAPLEHLSGGQNISYREQNKSANKELSRENRQNKRDRAGGGKESHAIFKKRRTELAAAKKQREQAL
ncbi:hypothetical protein L204_104970 [Cryptococcus depauperatus]